MSSYSQSITGALAGNARAPNVSQTANIIDIDDVVCNSTAAMQQAMRLNTPFLAQGPDGSQAWYTYDAERSIPGSILYLKKVT